ncbi:Rho GTPase activation protein [Tothia fuscella]|uniref:Rho GTPase activation protein n=1 Tax=Tothia fuscella TaxID=1048955 RepID=A0A9P4NGE7_9PEZI|nr:Rho GTPase activation protein [Tothia fuscella]
MAKSATSIIYRSPLLSPAGLPIYILNAAALPDTHDVDYDTLLPYVLARLPGEDELVGGAEYEVILFAGGATEGATSTRRNHPGVGWFLQAYHVLSRAMRKRIQKLYIVHQRTWVRMLVEVFSTVASPKFRRKIVHASTLSTLALHIPIDNILIPPSAFLRDRQVASSIHVPSASGRRAFGAPQPFPKNFQGQWRLPRVLRETTSFILMGDNINMEGLFRIPAHVKLKEILREAYDRGQKFIIWKEQNIALPLPRYYNAEGLDTIVAQADQSETYGVHLAAGLLKFWYAELREPLFPPSCYRDLKIHFGNAEATPSLEKLTEMLSYMSKWSILPITSRQVLNRHLLPLMSAVIQHSDRNKMTADNIAVCFAPTLLCGFDPVEDMKMSAIVRKILAVAADLWSAGLREALGIEEGAFAHDMQPPARIEDYEDPLDRRLSSQDETKSPASFHEDQEVGIILKDNDASPIEPYLNYMVPPPLPPRQPIPQQKEEAQSFAPPLPQRSSRSTSTPFSDETTVRRKPAPPLTVPPRYSTITASSDDVTESPSTYMAVSDGFAPARRGDWSFDADEETHTNKPTSASPSAPYGIGNRQESQIRRKPVTPTLQSDDEGWGKKK